jgi:hypothetical protein
MQKKCLNRLKKLYKILKNIKFPIDNLIYYMYNKCAVVIYAVFGTCKVHENGNFNHLKHKKSKKS